MVGVGSGERRRGREKGWIGEVEEETVPYLSTAPLD